MRTLALHGSSLGGALRRLFTREDGAILVETAFVMPILITMLLGAVEVGRYTLVNQKLERAAATVADLVAQSEDGVTLAELETLFGIIPHVTSPYDVATNGKVVVSAVVRLSEGSAPTVAWQIDGLGALVADSEIGTVGGDANLPSGFILPVGETMIVGETWYDYDALFFESVDPTGLMYHRSYYRPRLSSLSETPE